MSEGATSLESAIASWQLPILAQLRFIFGSKAFSDEWSRCLASFQVIGCRSTRIYILFAFEKSCIFNYCLLRLFLVYGHHCLSVVIYCTNAIYSCTVWLCLMYWVSRLHHESSSLRSSSWFESRHEFLKLWHYSLDNLLWLIHCLCNMEMVVVHHEMFSLYPSLMLWAILRYRWRSHYGRRLSVYLSNYLSGSRRVKVMMVGSHIRRCCCDLSRFRRSGSEHIMHNELTDGIIGSSWVESWLSWPC